MLCNGIPRAKFYVTKITGLGHSGDDLVVAQKNGALIKLPCGKGDMTAIAGTIAMELPPYSRILA